ncbi:MAG TPA: energy transducer TonB, partial [Anaeromyxobacter sp.]
TSPRAAPVPVSARAEAPAKARAPVLETRTCVADALRLPRGLEGSLPGEVVMHVDVAEDGRPANVSFPGSVDPRLRTALVAAVRTCRFTPGADASGRPAAAATTMRLRFE